MTVEERVDFGRLMEDKARELYDLIAPVWGPLYTPPIGYQWEGGTDHPFFAHMVERQHVLDSHDWGTIRAWLRWFAGETDMPVPDSEPGTRRELLQWLGTHPYRWALVNEVIRRLAPESLEQAIHLAQREEHQDLFYSVNDFLIQTKNLLPNEAH